MDYENFKMHRVREIQCIEDEQANISLSENITNDLFNRNFLNFNFINNTQLTNNSNLINAVYNNDENFNYQINDVNNLFQKINLNWESDENKMEIDPKFSNKNKYKLDCNNPNSIKGYQNTYDNHNLHGNLNSYFYKNY